MEGVAPPLALLLAVKRALEKGQSVRQGLNFYLKRHHDDFSDVVLRWFGLLQQGQSARKLLLGVKSVHRQVLLELLERGLAGESIYQALLQLESEIIEACQDELNTKLARLPFILLIPLLLFQFPSFLLLLFGPLLQNFFHSLGGG
ncbi:hypothetical protein D3C87_88080 [compost metagenome]